MVMSMSEFIRVRQTNMYTAVAVDEPVYCGSDVEYTVTGTVVKSYNTVVAVVSDNDIWLTPQWDCSRTTTKHVMEIVRTVADAVPNDLRAALLGNRGLKSNKNEYGVRVYRIFCTQGGKFYV